MAQSRGEQGAGEIKARFLVFTGDGDELVGCHRPVDGEDLAALRLQFAVEGVVRRQATGHQQGVHMAAHQHLGQLFFGSGLIFRADDEKLISLRPRSLFQPLGQLGVTGVLKVGQDKAQSLGLAATQGGGAAVRLIVMGGDNGHHLVAGGLTDAVLVGLAIDHIACRGARDTGEGGDFIQFHHIGSV